MKFLFELGLYTAPLLLPFFWRRLEATPGRFYLDLAVGLSCCYFFGVALRALGRCQNPVYAAFAKDLARAKRDSTTEAKV